MHDRHARTRDDTVFGALEHDLAVTGAQRRAGGDAAHADVAAPVFGAAADQVCVQQHGAAARAHGTEHVAVHGDALAFDHTLFLDVAELFVVAAQFQVAGGAGADAVAADDLVAHRDAAGRAVDLQEAGAPGHQEFAGRALFDRGALAGVAGQVEVEAGLGRQHRAGHLEAGTAAGRGDFLQQAHAGLDLGEAVLEAASSPCTGSRRPATIT